MDPSSVLKTDVFRNFISITIPGAIGTWPIIYYTCVNLNIAFNDISFLTSICLFITTITFGLLIEGIGGNLEQYLEKFTVKDELALDYYWKRYLLLKIENDKSSSIFRYMSSLISRFYFELHIIIALLFMYLEITILELIDVNIFNYGCMLLFIYAIGVIVLYYLYKELIKSIDILHKWRRRIVDYYDNENDEVLDDSYQSKKLLDYKEILKK